MSPHRTQSRDPAAPPRRLTIGRLCAVIAWFAAALGLARYREVWLALDAVNLGYPAAIVLYAWFWAGVALVARFAETTPGRFFGLGGVCFSMVVAPLPLPSRQVGIEPDFPGYFKIAMLLGSLAFAGAGALSWLIEWILARRALSRRRTELISNPTNNRHIIGSSMRNEAMSRNIETVNAYLDGFRENHHEKILSCLTDDIKWTVFGAFQLTGKAAYDKAIDGAPNFIDPPTLDVVRMVEQGDVVMAELTGTARRAAGGDMRMSMAEVFVMRDGKIAERRAWVIVLNENDYR